MQVDKVHGYLTAKGVGVGEKGIYTKLAWLCAGENIVSCCLGCYAVGCNSIYLFTTREGRARSRARLAVGENIVYHVILVPTWCAVGCSSAAAFVYNSPGGLRCGVAFIAHSRRSTIHLRRWTVLLSSFPHNQDQKCTIQTGHSLVRRSPLETRVSG